MTTSREKLGLALGIAGVLLVRRHAAGNKTCGCRVRPVVSVGRTCGHRRVHRPAVAARVAPADATARPVARIPARRFVHDRRLPGVHGAGHGAVCRPRTAASCSASFRLQPPLPQRSSLTSARVSASGSRARRARSSSLSSWCGKAGRIQFNSAIYICSAPSFPGRSATRCLAA